MFDLTRRRIEKLERETAGADLAETWILITAASGDDEDPSDIRRDLDILREGGFIRPGDWRSIDLTGTGKGFTEKEMQYLAEHRPRNS